MRDSYSRRLAALFLGLVTLAAFNRFTVAAQTASESHSSSAMQLKPSSLGQAGVKPAPFPESRSSLSFGARRKLNFSPTRQWGADVDKIALPAAGKNYSSQAYANAGFRLTPSTGPAAAKPVFEPSRFDNRKLRASSPPDPGKAQ